MFFLIVQKIRGQQTEASRYVSKYDLEVASNSNLSPLFIRYPSGIYTP